MTPQDGNDQYPGGMVRIQSFRLRSIHGVVLGADSEPDGAREMLCGWRAQPLTMT